MGGLAAQTWFRSGTLIASGDVTPTALLRPEQTLESARWIWGTALTPTGGAQYEPTLQTIPALIAKILAAVGLGPHAAQRLLLTLLFSSLGPAMYLLLRTLFPARRQRAPAAVGALFYAFNPSLFFLVPNAVLLANLVLLPLLAAIVLRGSRMTGWRHPILLTVASIPLSYAFMNPPAFAIVAVGSGIAFIVALVRGPRRDAAAFGVKALSLVALVNLWWVVPVAINLLGPTADRMTASTDPFGWTWTHARASIPNILRLTPNWAWPQATYYPYATTLESGLFVPIVFAPAAAALLAPVVAQGRARRIAIMVAASAVVLALLAKGMHAPLAGLNQGFFRLPGTWLFREPAAKFTPVLAGCFAVGMLLFAGALRGRTRRVGIAALVVIIAAGSYPLWTGAVVPDERPDLPSAHVRIPVHWQQAADFLNARPDRTLLLPANDYYQMPYSWGFYGADLIADELLDAPVIKLLDAEGNLYVAPDEAAAAMNRALRDDIAADRWSAAAATARALGIRWILVRGDIVHRWPGRRIDDPARLAARLSSHAGFSHAADFGPLRLFELAPDPVPPVQVANGSLLFDGEAAHLLGLSASVGMPLLDEAQGLPISTARAVLLDGWTATENGLSLEQTVSAETDAYIRWPDGIAARVRWEPGEVSIKTATVTTNQSGKLPSHTNDLVVPVDTRDPGLVRIGEDLLDMSTGPASRTIQIPVGSTTISVHTPDPRATMRDGSFEAGTWREVGDCHAADDRTPREAGLSAQRIPAGVHGTHALALTAHAHTACVWQAVDDFDPGAIYRLSLATRRIQGSPPRLCVWQHGPERCAHTPALPARGTWTSYQTLIRPEDGTTGLSIHLYADGTDEGTTIHYDNVQADRFLRRATRTLTIDDAWRRIQTVSGSTRFAVDTVLASPAVVADGSFEAGTWREVGDCHAADDRTPREAGLSAQRIPAGVHGTHALALTAHAHTACVWQAVDDFDPGAIYRLSLATRRIQGSPPRLCVWQHGPERCAHTPALPARGTWTSYQTLIRPEDGTTGLSIYLYADGTDEGTTIHYDNVQAEIVEPRPQITLVQTPLTQDPPPAIRVTQESQTSYHVAVHQATKPFLLTLNQTFDPGWRLDPDIASAHVRVNGYANGWMIDRSGAFTLRLTYTPQRIVDQARAVSAWAWILLGAAVLVRFVRARRSSSDPLPRQPEDQGRLSRSLRIAVARGPHQILPRANAPSGDRPAPPAPATPAPNQPTVRPSEEHR